MTDITLSGLTIYPVKSLAGIPLAQSGLDRFGLVHDRRWMLVDDTRVFLSQRRLPRMALIRQRIAGDELILQAVGQSDLQLPLRPTGGDRLKVKVWEDSCEALHCGLEADVWLSALLGQACRLVYMPDDVIRRVDPDYAGPTDQTAFSDGFPLLLISEASLADLNSRMAVSLPMSRFRPNLVVSGCEPYAEDGWARIHIGELGLRLVKTCSRCIITTIDPQTAERGAEPLKTLSSYRRRGNKVYFGQNLLHDGEGQLSLGMRLQVSELADGS